MTDSYNIYLMFLSFIIALLASFTALNLARKISSSDGWYQKLWILCSSFVMGVGIWSMHFIAMLAYPLQKGVTYQIHTVIFSILVAILGALVGFSISFRAQLKTPRLLIGGTFMGLAISGMHYIGMAALQDVDIRYQPLPFALSIIIAIVASITALYLSFNRNQSIVVSGLLMGAAITGMHYTGMSAAVMSYPTAIHHASDHTTEIDFVVMAIYVAFGTIVIFAISLISSLSADRRLAEQIALKASILESAIDCIMMFNSRGWIIEFNPAAEALFGYDRKDALGRTLFDFLFPFDKDGRGAASLYQLLKAKDESIIGKRIEMKAYRSDRSEFPVEITITGTQHEEKHIYTAYLRDLTEKKKSEQMIHQLAYFDLLTGLPNRNQFNQLFIESLDKALQNNQSLAILFLDVNRFKLINDTLGHPVGDIVLQKFSTLLSGSLDDHSSVSRLSGDEFVILHPLGNRKSASTQAEKIIDQLKTPFQINGRNVYVSTSIGISFYPIDGRDPKVLLKNADLAMYLAKERGGNHYHFFEEDMHVIDARRIALEQSLRKAIENNEISISYQPKFHIPTGKIVGVEALARWDSPELGIVSPREFIPIAEESGQIIALGEWVMLTACKQMKGWQDAGMEPVPIAVNLSAHQFQQEQLVANVLEVLHQTGLEARYLELEITENAAMNKDNCAINKLNSLKSIGISISVDDFGTGYSSLSYLPKAPVDTLKIDKSFVQDMSAFNADSTIIETIMAMTRSLKLDVLAVGVETKEQLAFLENLGCQYVQGYLYSVPLTAELFEKNYVIPGLHARLTAL